MSFFVSSGDKVVYEPTEKSRIKNLTPGKLYTVEGPGTKKPWITDDLIWKSTALPIMNDKEQIQWYSRRHFKPHDPSAFLFKSEEAPEKKPRSFAPSEWFMDELEKL